MATIFGRQIGRASGAGGVPIRRYEMLRHSRFIQFPRIEFGQEMTPHQVHWAIQDSLEDQGVADIKAYAPSLSTHWSKVPTGEGGNERNVSDYCVFEGGLKGSRGEPVPVWLKVLCVLAPVLGFMAANVANQGTLLVLGVLVGLGAFLYMSYLKKYRRGDVEMLYRGIYLAPEHLNPGQLSWRFSVDLMFSVNVKKPIGKPMVEPVYQAIVQDLLAQIKSNTKYKMLPELITLDPKALEARFPVQHLEPQA